VWGYYNLFNIARMPDEAFAQARVFRAIFTFGLPMLLVSNVPVRLLTDKLSSPGPLLLLILMSFVCFTLSELGWRASIRHYTSASS
jgi:ABC-2 type transport system permease protein